MTDLPTSQPLDTAEAVNQARILMQALPHMLRYDEAVVVVKYGGHAMGDEETARNFARDMVLLEQSGVNPVVVHGGGPQIGVMLKKLGIKSEFADGLRITDKATVEVVEMVLAGSINKQIVGYINNEGGHAIGLCGKDGKLVTAKKVERRRAGRQARRRLRVCRRAGQGRFDRARTGVGPRTDPGAGADRAGRGGRDLQCQRRHVRRRHRRRRGRQAPAAAHRRARRARQEQAADQAAEDRRHSRA